MKTPDYLTIGIPAFSLIRSALIITSGCMSPEPASITALPTVVIQSQPHRLPHHPLSPQQLRLKHWLPPVRSQIPFSSKARSGAQHPARSILWYGGHPVTLTALSCDPVRMPSVLILMEQAPSRSSSPKVAGRGSGNMRHG